jgi:hypothetical protein
LASAIDGVHNRALVHARLSRSRSRLFLLAALLSVSGCNCGDDDGGDGNNPGAGRGGSDGGTGPAGACAEDRVMCRGAVAMVCDGEGGFKDSIDCAERGESCVGSRLSSAGTVLTLGCVQCVPGTASCEDDIGTICREDGTGFDSFDCDPQQGMTCEPDGCKGVCAPPEVTTSYIGCDYYPTVTLNPVWSGFEFAVAISNASDAPVDVIITRGADTVRELEIGVDALEVVPLEWVPALKGGDQDACQIPPEPGDSRVVQDGAYRLRSNRPVTVYQLSPLQYELGTADDPPPGCPVGTECPGGIVPECLSYTNDASLLLPATALTGDYSVISWPSHGNTASFFAVTATADRTLVSLDGRGSFRPGDGVDAEGNGQIMLDRGDVLEVLAAHGDDGDDASGSIVEADKPVQIIGGHSCANIPDVDTAACDHLEEALFPTQILGSDYVVSYPAAVASESPHVLRIIAVKADTTVEFDPPVVDPITIGPKNEPYELQLGSYSKTAPGDAEAPIDVRVTGDKPILIAQYMQGQLAVPSGAGDPSMSLAVPIAQYRSEYIFTASTTYESNFVNVIGRIGIDVMLDGEPLDGDASDVGDSDYQVIRARLPAGGSGVHRISADQPFGLVVYGYGRYTSYMYPGGLDLKRITIPGPD